MSRNGLRIDSRSARMVAVFVLAILLTLLALHSHPEAIDEVGGPICGVVVLLAAGAAALGAVRPVQRPRPPVLPEPSGRPSLRVWRARSWLRPPPTGSFSAGFSPLLS